MNPNEPWPEMDPTNPDDIFLESDEELAKKLANLEAASIVSFECLHTPFTI